jgi:hypothetical protein
MTTSTLTRPAVFDEQATRDWLTTLHGQSEGFAWVGSTADRFKGRTFDTADPYWLERAVAHIGRLDRAGAAGTYVRTTTLRQAPEQGRGGDNDSHALPGLAADLDIAGPGHKTDKPLPPNPGAAKAIIDESGLPDPSVWVHSGGGLYAWWLLDRPHVIGADLERVKRLCARWQDPIEHAAIQLGYSHGRLGDLARILRVPGTVNRKPGMPEPRPCRVLEDTGRRYTLENLRGALVDALNALPAPEPMPVVRLSIRAGRTADNGISPGDDFELHVDWLEILGPHGWTLAYQQGGTRYWCRPGKDRRDGISASTGRSADRDRLWVFSDATELPCGRSLTKFHAYALLEHGGRHGAAARQLRRQGFGAQPERVAA